MRTEVIERTIQEMRAALTRLEAELERENQIVRKNRIGPPGPPPYGWQNQPLTDAERSSKIRKPMIHNHEEQAILKMIADLRGQGVPWGKIADAVNAAGYRTRGGGEWAFSSVQRRWSEDQKGDE